MKIHKSFLTLLLTILILSGCTKSGGSEDGGSGGGGDTSSDGGDGGSTSPDKFSTDCGVVSNGKLENPVAAKDGMFVRVEQVISDNLLAVSDAESTTGNAGRILVKIQGLGKADTEFKRQTAMDYLASSTSGGALFYIANKDCSVTLEGGGQGVVGNIINGSGISYGEEVIRSGFGRADTGDACGGELIGGCYKALEDSSDKPNMGTAGGDFLWKPDSDKDGKLVIHANPDVRIVVNGQELFDAGPGNGRASTGRGSQPGCAYGGNVKVELFDKFTSLPYTCRDGSGKQQPFITIGNGCERVEIASCG